MTSPVAPSGPLAKALAAVILAVLLVVGAMFSLVLIALVPLLVAIVGGWFWWKTRALRALMREQAAAGLGERPFESGGDIIEGEAVVVPDEARRDTSLPPPAR
ncbi:hypothetical protein HCX48_08440 [Rhodocyclus tenuis]|uniref:ABC transporter ATP-binding protein n=1 Tax=Rhodocyclus gracilis TaxID=2929842 RepID=A0ABX0WHR6_9RHOO|nr:hypothetical protein [Rhodocyclus gracilis]MRD72141.1 hypothetical protein [Rhodocyclus gracilis]NJA89247.1 hypothetical protein [Rhodocyclus gracilis]